MAQFSEWEGLVKTVRQLLADVRELRSSLHELREHAGQQSKRIFELENRGPQAYGGFFDRFRRERSELLASLGPAPGYIEQQAARWDGCGEERGDSFEPQPVRRGRTLHLLRARHTAPVTDVEKLWPTLSEQWLDHEDVYTASWLNQETGSVMVFHEKATLREVIARVRTEIAILLDQKINISNVQVTRGETQAYEPSEDEIG